MSHDHFLPAPCATGPWTVEPFWIQAENGERLGCREVQGFSDALAASRDPRLPTPARLMLVEPGETACAWIARWAEDAEHVRRTVRFHRALDDAEFEVVATLASYGYGVTTSLLIEAVRGPDEVIHRSGVLLKADVEAALARHDAWCRARRMADPSDDL